MVLGWGSVAPFACMHFEGAVWRLVSGAEASARFPPKWNISLRDKDVVTPKYHLIVLKHPVTERHSSAPA